MLDAYCRRERESDEEARVSVLLVHQNMCFRGGHGLCSTAVTPFFWREEIFQTHNASLLQSILCRPRTAGMSELTVESADSQASLFLRNQNVWSPEAKALAFNQAHRGILMPN